MSYLLSEERTFLQGELGYAFDLAADFAEAQRVSGLGSSAHAYLGTAIRCLLAGLDAEAVQLLEKSRHWLDAAIAEQEKPTRYFPNGTEAIRYQDLAMCNWLARDVHDTDSLGRFVAHEDAYLADSSAGKDKVSVSLVLNGYLDAGAYSRAKELIEVTPGLSVPKKFDRPRNEAAMAYVTALHRLGELNEGGTTANAKRFIEASASPWLGQGHYIRFAQWVKILHWVPGSGRSTITLKEALPSSLRG